MTNPDHILPPPIRDDGPLETMAGTSSANDREAWPEATYAQALRDLAPQFGGEPVAGVLRDAADVIDQRSKLAEERGAKYYELIIAVGNKHPGETRHQTALRYIVKAEQSEDNAENAQSKQAVIATIDTKEGE